MNSPSSRRATLPPAPPELQSPLRGALDVAFTLTAPDSIVVGPVMQPVQPDTPSVATLPGHPVPRTDAGSPRVALMVLHGEPWRQRVLRRIGPLLAEFTVNADAQLRRDLADEAAYGRPVTARWLAAGTLTFDPLGQGRVLVDHAAALLARGYRPSEAELGGRRVQALTDLNEARARLAADAIAAELLLAGVIVQIVDFAFASAGRWLPSAADRRDGLAEFDRAAAVLLDGCFQGFDVAARLRATERLADRILGTRVAPDWIGPRSPAAATGF